MFWRKWFVRSVVFSIVGACAAGAYLYERWTNPAAVREQVLRRLADIFPGASVSLDSAHLRLLGGIQVQELRLVRKGDRDNVDIGYIPSAVLYHDKEKLLDGELLLRKVELFRPRLRAYRSKEGTWNVQGLVKKTAPDQSLPTVVIHQGTLVLEDRATVGNVSSLEITDLNLKLINDPIATLQFEGDAQSATVGKLTVQGVLQRASGEIELTFSTRDTPLSTKLAQRLAPLFAPAALDQVDLAGAADIDTKVRWQPDSPLRYEIAGRFRDAAIRHPSLPISIENLNAAFKIADGVVTIEKATAQTGSTTIVASGRAPLADLASSFEVTIAAQKVPLDEETIRKLPPKVMDLYRMFRPVGLADISMKLARKEGRWAMTSDGGESVITVQPAGASATLVYFAYPTHEITGSVNHYLVTGRTHFDLEGRAAGQPVSFVGKTVGAGKDLDLTVTGRVGAIPIDETLLKSLPGETEKLARSFRPTGTVEAIMRLRHEPGAEAFRNEFSLTFRDATVCWETFPLKMKKLSGRLAIGPEKWEFHDFRGESETGGLLAISGKTFAVPGKSRPGVEVKIDGRNIALDASLRAALEPMPPIVRAWETFRPSGVMNFRAEIRLPSENLDKLDVLVTASGATVEPAFFRYKMTDVGGIVHFRNRRLELAALSGRHGDTRWVLGEGGVIELRAGGGYKADLPNIDVDQLLLDADLVRALPESLRRPCETLSCKAPIRARARLVVEQGSDPGDRPDIYWDTQAWVKDASIFIGVPAEGVTGVIGCRGRHDGTKLLGVEGNLLIASGVLFKQQLTDVASHFHVAEQTPGMLLADLHAPIYDGSITGEIRVDFDKDVRYELNLTAAQIDLQKLGRKNIGESTKLEGKAVGRLHLTGTSAGIRSLDGTGSFDVTGAKLYNLPLLLDLLKFLGLRWPDRTAFEELHALFRIQGPRVAVKRLELQGNAISLTGQGEFNLDGTDLALDFCPTWARIDQLLPPALRAVPPAVSKNFLVIEMRGKVGSDPGDLKFTKKPMPVILDPIESVRQRLWGPPASLGAPSGSQETPIPSIPFLGPTPESRGR